MHGKVDRTTDEGLLQFLGEDSFVENGIIALAELTELQIRALVADGLNHLDLDFNSLQF